jgi:cellulose synthase/poly-beta-1,6-N-acetylglucosamine synthase-like glycosyltransferase
VWRDQAGLIRSLEALDRDPTEFDILVVDDGSPTPIELPSTFQRHRTELIRSPANLGVEGALNLGLSSIRTVGYEFTARLDAGDIALPGRIARQMEFLDAHPDVVVVGTWARCYDDNGRYLFTLRFPEEHEAILKKMRYVSGLLHPAVMMRTAALERAGPYSDNYKAAEDYELFWRLSEYGILANIPETLTEYVISESGITLSQRRRTLIGRLQVKWSFFGYTDPHSYLGVMRTFLFLIIPFPLLLFMKRYMWK